MLKMAKRRFGLMTLGLSALAASSGANAQLFLTQPDFKSGAIAADDPLVGRPIPGATAAENPAMLL